MKEAQLLITVLAAVEEGELTGITLTTSLIGWPTMPRSEDLIECQRSHVESWIYRCLANTKHIWAGVELGQLCLGSWRLLGALGPSVHRYGN